MQSVSFLSYLFHELRQYGPFLVIVPLSTITAWQSQFATWAPDINVITYIGTAAARDVIRNYEFGPSNKKLKMNVLLTTYEITLRDVKELGDIKWQVLAVDEVRTCCLFDLQFGVSDTIFVIGPSPEELRVATLRGTELFLSSFEASHHGYALAEQRPRYAVVLLRLSHS